MSTMPDIQDVSFGNMTISGRPYNTDLLITPSGAILENWRRQQGHYLQLADISKLLAPRPGRIIIGTGVSGRMKIAPDLIRYMENNAVTLHIHPNTEAVRAYNKYRNGSRLTAAAFHLTC